MTLRERPATHPLPSLSSTTDTTTTTTVITIIVNITDIIIRLGGEVDAVQVETAMGRQRQERYQQPRRGFKRPTVSPAASAEITEAAAQGMA